MTLLADRPVSPPEEPATRVRRSWRDVIEPRHITLAVAALAVAYLALVPIGTMIYASLQTEFLGTVAGTWTFQHYIDTFTAPGFGELVRNSFVYATATAVFSTAVGFGLAWLVVR